MTDKITFSRRDLLKATGAGALALPLVGTTQAAATTPASATALVDLVAAEITRIINSGQNVNGMISDFDRLMGRFGDMATISQSVLGPAARSASRSDINGFTTAFQGYMARKYGRRFREFIGGTVTATGAQQASRFVEVISQVTIPGTSPFEVRFRVWDRSGQDLFIDIIIEGVSLVITERTEIGSLLDRNGGSISALTQELRNFG